MDMIKRKDSRITAIYFAYPNGVHDGFETMQMNHMQTVCPTEAC